MEALSTGIKDKYHTYREKFMGRFQSTSITAYIWSFIRGVLILGISYIILQPLLFNISTSLMSPSDLFDLSVQWIPRNFNIINYVRAYITMNYPTAFIYSFSLALAVSLLQLFSCTIIGYGFARFEFRGKNLIFALVIFTLIVPPQLIILPLYTNFRYFTLFGLIPEPGLNLLGSFWPFLLTAITGTGLRNGLFIYIMRQFFKGMPTALEESAYVDGAGPLNTFVRVMLPGAIPAMIVVFLFSFVWQWNDDFFTTIYLRGGNVELLGSALADFSPRYIEYHTEQFGEWPPAPYLSALMNAGQIMFIAPLLLLYVILQRHFVESVQRTGIVG